MTAKNPKRNTRPGVDRAGRTLLHYAANEGNLIRVRELLDSGLDPRSGDDNGWTPLHFAAQCNSPEVAAVLLQAGAPVDPRDSHGNTPLMKAVFNSKGSGDMINLLRAHGADPNVKNADGNSPLNLARTIANFDVKQFFRDISTTEDNGV